MGIRLGINLGIKLGIKLGINLGIKLGISLGVNLGISLGINLGINLGRVASAVLPAGVVNIPAVALGMFSGGLCMKKLKLSLMGAAKFAFGTSLIGYFLSLFFLAMSCENAKVAGVTLPYDG